MNGVDPQTLRRLLKTRVRYPKSEEPAVFRRPRKDFRLLYTFCGIRFLTATSLVVTFNS